MNKGFKPRVVTQMPDERARPTWGHVNQGSGLSFHHSLALLTQLTLCGPQFPHFEKGSGNISFIGCPKDQVLSWGWQKTDKCPCCVYR